jgi:hypothetical protein
VTGPVHHLAVLLALAGSLGGCTSPQCAATEGTWDACGAGSGPTCVDGVVRNDPSPAVCEAGCQCPAALPVWDEERGCITEGDCTSVR